MKKRNYLIPGIILIVIRRLLLICLALSMFLQVSPDPKEEDLTPLVPEDFAFSMEWDIYGCSSYDSETGILIQNSFVFFIPELTEQKRIAELFGEIDKRIVNASRSVNEMQSLKQGLLQQLFI